LTLEANKLRFATFARLGSFAASFASDAASTSSASRAASLAYKAAAFAAPLASRAACLAASTASLVASASATSISEDIRALQGGLDPQTLAGQRLWREGAPEALSAEWDRLKELLLAREGEHWQVWTHWYDARLRGDPARCALEMARVLELTEDDLKDPLRTNAKLAEIEARFELRSAPVDPAPDRPDPDASPPDHADDAGVGDLLEQRPAAYGFRKTPDGTIEGFAQTGAPVQPELLDELISELRDKAARYCDTISGISQPPPSVLRTANAIKTALDEWAERPAPGVLWMRRNALLGNLMEYNTGDGRAELYDGAIGEMADLAQSILDVLSLYPSVQALVARATTLELKPGQADAVEQDIRTVADSAQGFDVAGPSAIQSLNDGRADVDEAAQTVAFSSDPDRRAEAQQRKLELTGQRVLTTRNFLAELVRAGQDGAIDGVRSSTQLAVKGGILALIATLATPLVAVAAAIPAFGPIKDRALALAQRGEDEAVHPDDGASPDDE
jgi:hypothetical protein